MGTTRNGARTYLDVIAKACKLSRLPGFRTGLRQILGTTDADALFAVWEPLCLFVDFLLSTDDWYNKRDATLPDNTDGEDAPFG